MTSVLFATPTRFVTKKSSENSNIIMDIIIDIGFRDVKENFISKEVVVNETITRH